MLHQKNKKTRGSAVTFLVTQFDLLTVFEANEVSNHKRKTRVFFNVKYTAYNIPVFRISSAETDEITCYIV